jgi:hypothetical protein
MPNKQRRIKESNAAMHIIVMIQLPREIVARESQFGETKKF